MLRLNRPLRRGTIATDIVAGSDMSGRPDCSLSNPCAGWDQLNYPLGLAVSADGSAIPIEFSTAAVS